MQCLHRNPLSRPDLRFRNRRMEAEFVNDPASSCRRLATLTSIINICLSIGCTVLLQGWKRYLQCACVILESGLELLARCPPSPASTGLRLWLGHALRLGFLLVLGLHVSIPTPYTYSGPHPSLQALRWAAVCSRAPLLAWAALGQAPLLHQRLLSLPLVLAAALLASPGCTCLEAGAEVLRGGSGWIGSDLAFLLARTGMGAGLESVQLAARARPAQALCVTLHWAALVFGVILPQLVSLSAEVRARNSFLRRKALPGRVCPSLSSTTGVALLIPPLTALSWMAVIVAAGPASA
ncbi:hypothetical protein ACKKBF_B09405 [Auxenochlorella protothecoides x Auxenochlorella symbiontica]